MEYADKTKLRQVVEGGYCIGCGACAVAESNVRMVASDQGGYKADIIAKTSSFTEEVCPFASSLNEDDIGESLYSDEASHDERIGYFQNIYAGFVSEPGFRAQGSSGGMVTWVLARLLDKGLIDGVIHVGETATPGSLFEYRVSESREEILANAKSRYYPVHFDAVLEKIRGDKKRYAFVGVPCFVKSVRLLAEKDPLLAENLRFCIAIFCGHFKTQAFAEMIGWQQGVGPERLSSINFRVKYDNRPANQYGVQVSRSGSENPLPPVLTRELYGMDWGLGYFKPKACDWCDDIAGETADLSCGDAWLPEFSNSPQGTNIVIVRNTEIAHLLDEGRVEGALELVEQSVDKVYESQAGNYRHRREGLSVRILDAEARGAWHPAKRITASTFDVSERRAKIYRLRAVISGKSHTAFRDAKERRSFLVFYMKMFPLEMRYYWLNERLLKGMAKSFLSMLFYMRRKWRKIPDYPKVKGPCDS